MPQRSVFYHVVSAVTSLALAGCPGPATPESDRRAAGSGVAVTDVIEHDFGKIEPEARLQHVFTLKNPTDRAWTLKKVVQSCTCSVATASTERIEPHSSGEFTFTYRAPSKTSDERRWVTLHFEGAEEIVVNLVITALVRPLLVLQPDPLDLGAVFPGRTVERSVQVVNYGKEDWPGIEVLDLPDWLRVLKITPTSPPADSAAPRQSWTVDLLADPKGVPEGVYRHTVRLRRAGGGPHADLSVLIASQGRASITPSAVMFGAMRGDGPPQSKTLIVRFYESSGSESTQAVELESKLAKNLTVTWKAVSANTWRGDLRFDPTGLQPGILSEKIRFTIPGTDVKNLEVFLNAKIVD